MKYVEELIGRYPSLCACKEGIEAAIKAIDEMHQRGNKLLLCGNGGSAADCSHISGELLKGFLKKRPYPAGDPAFEGLQQGIAAIPLNSLDVLISAFANDVEADLCYAQLVGALGRKGDVFLGISTSGNAKIVCAAAKVAKALGMITVSMTGEGGGTLGELCDIAIKAPERETFKIQELHLPIYHAICAQCEEDFFKE